MCSTGIKSKYNYKINDLSQKNNNYPQIKELSNAFYYPVNFGSKIRSTNTTRPDLAETTSNFEVAKQLGVTCPACGKKMLNKATFFDIAQKINDVEPDNYLDFIGQYQDYMRPVEEIAYNEISELSKMTGIKDIRKLVVILRDEKLPILQEVQEEKTKQMRDLATTLPQDERIELSQKVRALEKIIRNTRPEAPFRRKIMIEGLKKVQISNPVKYEKLQTIAQEFPTSADIDSAWIVKYSGKNKQHENWTSHDIALRLLEGSIANTDHIIAYDIDNNHNDISNYISMHSNCNSQKGNKPFLEWLNEDKENRINYMKRHFDEVDDLIINGEITDPKYKNYVVNATQTIYEVSNGEVKLYPDTGKKDA